MARQRWSATLVTPLTYDNLKDILVVTPRLFAPAMRWIVKGYEISLNDVAPARKPLLVEIRIGNVADGFDAGVMGTFLGKVRKLKDRTTAPNDLEMYNGGDAWSFPIGDADQGDFYLHPMRVTRKVFPGGRVLDQDRSFLLIASNKYANLRLKFLATIWGEM